MTPNGIAGVNTRAKITEESGDEDDDRWRNIRYFSRKEFACKYGRYCGGYPAQKQPEVWYAYAIDTNYVHMDVE